MLAHVFGPVQDWPSQDLIAFSSEFDAELVLAAYRSGVFPMPLHGGPVPTEMGWWSPMQRGILGLDDLRVTRSLAQSMKRYTTSVDLAFTDVLARCADGSRPDGWIDADISRVYTELHDRGIAHSIETWDASGALVGGLYGVSLGGLFAGESMFHDHERGRDASKVALVRLVQVLGGAGPEVTRLLDVQWVTDHLESLGAVEVPRTTYLELLDEALDAPGVDWHAVPHAG